MNIKFLSCLIPEEFYDEIKTKSHNNMEDAASSLQWHIHEGLCANYKKDIELINVIPIGSFPQYYSDAFIASVKFKSTEGDNNLNIGFCNIKFIKRYVISLIVYRKLLEAFEGDDEGILYVYTISSTFMQAVYRFKKIKPNIKICAIVADLPNMTDLVCKKSIVKEKYSQYLANKSFEYITNIDAFVLLTQQMADYLMIKKPYVVMEGVSTTSNTYSELIDDSSNKTILYTGTLNKRFGIINLIEAFKKIEGENYRLVICGVGDASNEINESVKQDKRIHFKGQVSRNESLKLQRMATVLVNPRQNVEEFTKYSFPSKIMEYLSSGKPVIAYKLDGIPDEYDDYICYVKDNSIKALKNKLIEICEMDELQRKSLGEKGKRFVLEQKNSIKQTKRIKEMMDLLE